MPIKRNLDGEYFRIMRDGKGLDVCWTDLEWEDRVEQARRNNNEGWLIRMIQIMNDVAWQIHEAYPDVEINEIHLRDGVKSTKTWLRNSLFKITCEIRLAAEEHNIIAERC
jgi:hypothetical protein